MPFQMHAEVARIPSSAKVNQQNQKLLWLPLPVIKKISLVLHNFIFVMPFLLRLRFQVAFN